MNTIDIKAPAAMVRNLMLNPDIALRLNPSWQVKEIKATGNNLYALTLYDDRTEDSCQVILSVEVFGNSVNYGMNSAEIEFSTEEMKPALTRLSIRGNFFREEDLPYWLKGLQNYIVLEKRQSRFIKWLLDRFWLRMSPSQRRIAMIIIIAEGIGLAALIAVAIAMQLMK
ncbi:MAG: hypothetical protein RDU01_01385 [Thermodesulfovibrionales bacterium]|nr:hypothetical protein [Thermodesulfovibrionales bacterium]